MKNRTLVILTSLVLLGMLILLGINMTAILTGKPQTETYIQYNHVRGMTIQYHEQLFTLNFAQQNRVIEILNRSVRVMGVKPGKREKPDIQKIVIYQFDQLADLIVQPIAYVNRNLVFSAPQWNEEGLFMEVSDGELRSLLSQSYDH